MKILIIDDDSQKAFSAITLLKEIGLEAISILPQKFGDGREWVGYDIVVLDYEMWPSGLEMVPMVRESNPRTIIIGYSIRWGVDGTASELVDYCVNDSNELVSTMRGLYRFFASDLDEKMAKNRLIGKKIKIHREVDSSFGDKVDQTILVESIEPSIGEDDCQTDVSYYINGAIRVWREDDLEITIL